MVIKVAIVGGGFGLYGLLPAFDALEGCKVVSICGKRTERLQKDCKKAGIERVYTDWKKMLETEKPDAVAIAVVPKHQQEIARYALEHGMAVWAEKPLAVSVKEAKTLQTLAEKKHLPSMVDFLYPEIDEFAEAKNALEKGGIGKILGITVEWKFLSYDLKNAIKSWKTDPKQGGGALLFYFPHVFYYLEYFLGKINGVECTLFTSEKSLNHGETMVKMVVLFENGCVGNIYLDIASEEPQKHRIEFRGEEGTLVLQNTSDSWVDGFELVWQNGHGPDKRAKRRLAPDARLSADISEDPRVKLVRKIAGRFIDWCNTGRASRPDFQDGVRVQELIEMARESSTRRGPG